MNLNNNLKALTVPLSEVDFVEALLKSKGFMFSRTESDKFPFNKEYKGWVYMFICNGYQYIEILDLLNQIP